MTVPTSAAGHDGAPVEGKCNARKKQGPGHCTQVAGWGTSHVGVGNCKLHGGSTDSHVVAASKELARRECEALGVPLEGIDPGSALLGLVAEAAGNVEFYRRLVQDLHQGTDQVTLEDGEFVASGRPGIAGRVKVDTLEAKPHVLVVLYNEERDRLADLCSRALKAGVEERRVRLVEADARQLFGLFAEAFTRVGMPDKLQAGFRRELAVLLREQVTAGAAHG